jgi:chemotaxis protein methyltransferase CheR
MASGTETEVHVRSEDVKGVLKAIVRVLAGPSAKRLTNVNVGRVQKPARGWTSIALDRFIDSFPQLPEFALTDFGGLLAGQLNLPVLLLDEEGKSSAFWVHAFSAAGTRFGTFAPGVSTADVRLEDVGPAFEVEFADLHKWCESLANPQGKLLDRLNTFYSSFGIQPPYWRPFVRRSQELGHNSISEYSALLSRDPSEWIHLNALSPMTGFWRNPPVWLGLESDLLPAAINFAAERGDSSLSVWSAGCCTGQEPYTLAAIWHERLRSQGLSHGLALDLLATDAVEDFVKLTRRGLFRTELLKELPEGLRGAFEPYQHSETDFPDVSRASESLRASIRCEVFDLARDVLMESFHVVLCRNVVAVFDAAGRTRAAVTLADSLKPGGWLVLGEKDLSFFPTSVRDRFTSCAVAGAFRKNAK